MEDHKATGASTLFGIRVIDTSRCMAGRFASRMMADFGADVVRVDVDRLDSFEDSAFRDYLSLGKRSIAINPATPRGHAVFERVIATADVIFRGTASQEGVFSNYTREALSEIAPSAVITTIAAAGEPESSGCSGAEELLMAARSGWAAINQVKGHPPLKPSGHQAGFQTGVAAFTATLAELYNRENGNLPDAVDISMLEVLVSTLSPALLQFQYQGESRSRHRTGFPFGPVPAKDGYFVLTTSRAHFWRDAMNALGLPDLAEDPRFADAAARDELYAEVGPLVSERIGQHDKAELFNTLGTLRVSAGAVLDVAELTTDPHLSARQFFVEAPLGEAGTVRIPGAPFEAPESGWAIKSAAPRYGEHTTEVLSESGFSSEDIEGLYTEGAVS